MVGHPLIIDRFPADDNAVPRDYARTVPIPGRRSAPVLVVCAADDGRRAAVVAQLEERYSATYDVVSAGTASETADVLRTTAGDGRQVAILLADDPGFPRERPHGLPVGLRALPRRAARPARGVGRLG